MSNRSELVALFEDVHAERIALQSVCTCADCAAEFDIEKATRKQLTPAERKGHVQADTPMVVTAAKRIALVFKEWRRLLLAEIERVTKPTITRKAMEFVGLAKAEVSMLDNNDVDLVLRRMFGPTKQQRLEELSRPRLLAAIDGYKQGQEIARAALEEDVVLGPVKEIGKELIDNMLSEAMKLSETTLQMVDDRIRDEMLASVLRGDSVNETANRLGEVFNGLEDYESLRIARTETARAQVQAMTDVYQEQGALFVRWLKSPAACPICQAYDGKIYSIEDFRAHFPAHPNCVCAGEYLDTAPEDEPVSETPPWNVFDDEFVYPDNAESLKKGASFGHPFYGNQYTEGTGGEGSQSRTGKQGIPFSSAKENRAHGQKSLDHILENHNDIPNAMHRKEVGFISFYWGTPGDPKNEYKGGSGIAHIEAKHGKLAARKMPDVIAHGKVGQQYNHNGPKRAITLGKWKAVLALEKHGNKETWLVTGFGPKEEGSR